MMEIKSLSTKRIIVPCQIEGRCVNFLIDTGASVGLVSCRLKFLRKGRPYNGTIIGVGGEIKTCVCNSFALLGGRQLAQFLIADIGSVIDSIKRETGIEIGGIISLPQMQLNGIEIATDDNLIRI